MHSVLFDVTLPFGDVHYAVTAWMIIGFVGVVLFAGRWVVQLLASGRTRRPTFPRLFWVMSLAGSILLLLYFSFGHNDPVGILSNLFPAFVAGYNLVLELSWKPSHESTQV